MFFISWRTKGLFPLQRSAVAIDSGNKCVPLLPWVSATALFLFVRCSSVTPFKHFVKQLFEAADFNQFHLYQEFFKNWLPNKTDSQTVSWVYSQFPPLSNLWSCVTCFFGFPKLCIIPPAHHGYIPSFHLSNLWSCVTCFFGFPKLCIIYPTCTSWVHSHFPLIKPLKLCHLLFWVS